LLDLHQCAPHLLADWLDGCSLFFCVFLLVRSFAWSRPVFQTFPVRRACTRAASVMFRRSYQLLSSVSVQLFLLISIGKFASDPHDLVTTGPHVPPPTTGINNQTLPCEILNCLFDGIVIVFI